MTRNPSNSRAIKPAPSGTTTGYVDYDGGVVHAAGLPRGAPRAEANGARLVGARGAPAGWERREVEAWRVLHHVRQGKMVVRGRVDEPSRVRALQAELVPDPELAQVGLDEEDGRAGSLGRHAGQVDRRRCLTVARGRARYRHHLLARLFRDVRSWRYCSASNEQGARKLTKCSPGVPRSTSGA